MERIVSIKYSPMYSHVMPLTPDGYRPRIVDDMLERKLRVFGAVSVEGPKWCGKTWTAENHADSEIKIAENRGPLTNRDYVLADVRRALTGDPPHLIDEWQEVPQIWDSVRSNLDSHPGHGRYILTGSSVPKRETYIHSGTGRIARLKMRTMTLFETGDSDGSVSLRELMQGNLVTSEKRDVELEQLVDLVVRGGWPTTLTVDPEDYGLVPKEYIESAIEDACRLDGRQRDREKMRMLLRSLSRNESTVVSNETVKDDMKSYDDEKISNDTFYDYSDCLDRIHLLEDTPSFKPNFRSSVRVGKKPKRHLTDVSLAVAALGLNRENLMGDLNTFGFMFEALCEHDLQIYAESAGGTLYHYRDDSGREVDAVVEAEDGSWGAFEIKLGAGQIDGAAEHLLKMRDVFESRGGSPCVLCVISGLSNWAYQRPDGVFVVPITSLGP